MYSRSRFLGYKIENCVGFMTPRWKTTVLIEDKNSFTHQTGLFKPKSEFLISYTVMSYMLR